MELKVRFLKWSAGIPVAMLNQKTAEVLGVHIKDRISIKTSSRKISTIIDTIGSLVKENEIAVSSEIKNLLNLKSGEKVDVILLSPPRSLNFIKEKLNNKKLNKEKIWEIVKDISNNSLSEAETALFVSAMYNRGMDFKETVFLTDAIANSGNKLTWNSHLVADKHSIGGIPGNRTTPIIVSICCSSGLIMPKSSSRAITSAAGTADVIETIAKVEFSISEIKKIVNKTNGCLVWGGSWGLAPADDKIIQVEKVLKIDPEAQLLASIMAKKIAAGSNYILIDIPYGKYAKVNEKNGLRLKNSFEKLGKYFHKNVRCVLTDGSQPIGNGIGPALELLDIIKVLKQESDKPEDLEKKSVFLAGQLFELTGKAKKGEGESLAKGILSSGKAWEKFNQIIKAQSGNINKIKSSKFKKDIFSKKSGVIREIDNKKINSLARVAGCPADKSSGIYLYHHVGERVTNGEKLLTIYAESKIRLNEAEIFYKKNKIISLK
jgi:putative thymidine phosphorylase